jgi:hypothetical protein
MKLTSLSQYDYVEVTRDIVCGFETDYSERGSDSRQHPEKPNEMAV